MERERDRDNIEILRLMMLWRMKLIKRMHPISSNPTSTHYIMKERKEKQMKEKREGREEDKDIGSLAASYASFLCMLREEKERVEKDSISFEQQRSRN